jgi:hypothetical protein
VNNHTSIDEQGFGLLADSASAQLTQSDEETLVADARSELKPSEVVEQRLIGLMKSSPILVSHTQRQLKPSFR